MNELTEAYRSKNMDYYSYSRPELLEFIDGAIETALDVGCGAGNFGQMLKEIYRCEVWGIEPEERAAQQAAGKIDRIINGSFTNMAVQGLSKKFDHIFFNDVLEHLTNPDEALQLAATLLTPGGKIIASIPNIRFYPAMLQLIRYKDFKYLDAGVMDKTHLRFFTEKSMVRLFTDCGLKVKIVKGINRHRFRYLEILNAICFNQLSDMRFPQFVIVAQV